MTTADSAAATPPGPAMSAMLARNWWALALRGVLAILFGLGALLLPLATIGALMLFFAAYMLADGVLGIVAGLRAAARHERWGLLVLEGLLGIAAGCAAFLLPGLSVVVFVLLLGAWSVASGVVLAAASWRLDAAHGRWWLLLAGVVSVLWGVLLAVFPVTGAVVLTWWLGGYAVAFGAALLVLAFRLRGRRAA
jgi:uncharacterized membrane protein HdeD (DUF308 family)